jgi:hypothetical protein
MAATLDALRIKKQRIRNGSWTLPTNLKTRNGSNPRRPPHQKAAHQERIVDASDQSGIQVPILRNDSD